MWLSQRRGCRECFPRGSKGVKEGVESVTERKEPGWGAKQDGVLQGLACRKARARPRLFNCGWAWGRGFFFLKGFTAPRRESWPFDAEAHARAGSETGG
jgi:hypothetical protein